MTSAGSTCVSWTWAGWRWRKERASRAVYSRHSTSEPWSCLRCPSSCRGSLSRPSSHSVWRISTTTPRRARPATSVHTDKHFMYTYMMLRTCTCTCFQFVLLFINNSFAGFMMGMRSFAPVLGFMLGAWTNSLYVDLTGVVHTVLHSDILVNIHVTNKCTFKWRTCTSSLQWFLHVHVHVCTVPKLNLKNILHKYVYMYRTYTYKN